MRDQLLSNIVKGATYIESIGKDHPKYLAAMKRYDELCNQLEELKQKEQTPEDVQSHMDKIRELLNPKNKALKKGANP